MIVWKWCSCCSNRWCVYDSNCSSKGDGCTCGWVPSAELRSVPDQYTAGQSEAHSQEYLAHLPEQYEHHHRGDDVDEALVESHRAMPSGRKANLLAWKTYGPLAMRERFV